MELSKTQIDRLGERLKVGPLVEADLILLDQYRQSFSEAYQVVFRSVSEELQKHNAGAEPTGRSAKSTGSIIAKLQRESIRLTQMQDIAGCRVVVPDIVAQDNVVSLLSRTFPDAVVVDRRAKPSHGYRAVHVISKVSGKPIEIQIRSRLQHLWAQVTEKFSDGYDASIKYGGGDEIIQDFLGIMSAFIEVIENEEKQLTSNEQEVHRLAKEIAKYEFPQEIREPLQFIEHRKERIANILEEIGNTVSALERERELSKHEKVKVAINRGLDMLTDFLFGRKNVLNVKSKRKQ